LITGDGRFQQALLGIQHAQLQVVLRQLRLQAEARGGEVGGAGLHVRGVGFQLAAQLDRKSTRLNSSHVKISYAVFCLKKNIEKRHISITQVLCMNNSSLPCSFSTKHFLLVMLKKNWLCDR